MNDLTRILLFFALAPAVQAQSTLYTFVGNSTGDRFGHSVADAGDVDGDGLSDVIVGAFLDDDFGLNSGSARVLSGATGAVLHRFFGDSTEDEFGFSVDGAGDVDGDGHADLIVGAHLDDSRSTNAGSATVFSGVDGSVLYKFYGDSSRDFFGISVSGAGDVDGDGHADVIVGAWADDNTDLNAGSARVFSGANGRILYTFDGDSFADIFGGAVGGAGDVNGDGYDDVIVSAEGDDNNGSYSGSARVFSGADGSALYTFDGDSEGDAFGSSVDGAGDVDGDGHADLIVGAKFAGPAALPGRGLARIFSGADGSVLYTFVGDDVEDEFGVSVAGVGDVNGDGRDDVAVGARRDDNLGPESGSARVFSGLDGTVLFTLDGGTPGIRFGTSVAGGGDVNGDGHADLVVGAHFVSTNGPESGGAFVLSGCDVVGTTYCGPAVPNSSGQPATIVACGSDSVATGYFMLQASDLPPNQYAYFLASRTQGLSTPAGSQGNLCLGGTIGRFDHPKDVGQGPSFGIRVDLAAVPQPTGSLAVQAGETWNFQCWYRDENPGQTSNFTEAVSVTFQ